MTTNSETSYNSTLASIGFGIFFFFFVELLSDFIESIYALCLMSLSLNENVAAVLFILAALFLIIFKTTIPRFFWFGSGIVVLLFRSIEVIAAGVPKMLLSGIGVASFMILLPSLLQTKIISGSKYKEKNIAYGISFTLLLSILYKTINSGATLLGGNNYLWINWVIAFCGLTILIKWFIDEGNVTLKEENEVSKSGVLKTASMGTGILSVIILVYFAFGSPSILSRWVDGSYTATVILITLGFLIVSLLIVNRSVIARLPKSIVLLINLLFIISLVATIYVNQIQFLMVEAAYPLMNPESSLIKMIPFFIMLFLSPVILINTLFYARELLVSRPTPRQLGIGFFLSSFIMLLMIFFHIFTTVYDYIPVVGPFFRDKFWFVYLLVALGASLPIIIVSIEKNDNTESNGLFNFFNIEAIISCLISSIVIVSLFITLPSIGEYQTDSSSLKVLTFNIQQGYNNNGEKDLEGQLRFIKRLNPHIIGLQESDLARISGGNTDIVRYFADNLKMHSYYGPKPVNGTFGIALLSKYPIEKANTFYMYSVGEQTATIEAQVKVKEKSINVYVTHLGNDGDMVQLQAIMKQIGGKNRVICMGDFNFNPSKEQYGVATKIFNDAWLLKWPNGIDNEGFNPDNSLGEDGRIDHMFLSKDLKVKDCRILKNDYSDHPALITIIKGDSM